MFSNLQMPEIFRRKLAKNFCAMKYMSTISEYEKLMIIQKARTLSTEEEIERFVKDLGNIG